jgi:uncharacterized alpha-E superfamily protein
MPRSLKFCVQKAAAYASDLNAEYGTKLPSLSLLSEAHGHLNAQSIEQIMDSGLHEFLSDFVTHNHAIAQQIERDFRFYE